MHRKMILLLALTVAGATASAETIRFAKFKFQPDSKYKITINQDGKMTTSSGDEAQQSPGKNEKFGDLTQSLKLIIEVTTDEVGKGGVIPLEILFRDLQMEVGSGGEKLPIDIPQSELRGKKYLGELNDKGEIEVTEGSSGSSLLQAKGIDPVQILYIIPDLPEKEFKVGDSFDVETDYPGSSASNGSVKGTINYKISKIEGDNVLIETKVNSRSSDSNGGVEKESAVGSTGLITYSLKDKVCKSIKVDVVVNTTMGSKGAKPTSVIVNKMHLEVAIEPMK